MTYFTSDQHFGHFNIIRLSQRPFASLEEMDEVMLAKWNAKVKDSDRVFILGDLFFRAQDPEGTLRLLKGRKTLILGNHDSSWTGKVDLSRYFEGVHTMLETSDGEHTLTLCHYPMMTFNHCMRAYMVHGHIHGNTNADYWPYLQSHDRILNASVEVNNYEPVTFAELLANNQRYKAQHPERAMCASMAEHLWLFRKIWNFMPNMNNELFSRDWTIVQLVAAQ